MTSKELLRDIQEFLDQLGTAKPLYVSRAKELSKAIDYHMGVLDNVSETK
tara:strand:- start:154 stop:303 length:150 start_codon:yes stop_codon:yes gene_type:complete